MIVVEVEDPKFDDDETADFLKRDWRQVCKFNTRTGGVLI